MVDCNRMQQFSLTFPSRLRLLLHNPNNKTLGSGSIPNRIAATAATDRRKDGLKTIIVGRYDRTTTDST